MNKTDTSANDMKRFVLRLPPEVYTKVWQKVVDKKQDAPGYSINQYITELVLKDLGKK